MYNVLYTLDYILYTLYYILYAICYMLYAIYHILHSRAQVCWMDRDNDIPKGSVGDVLGFREKDNSSVCDCYYVFFVLYSYYRCISYFTTNK